MYETFYGLTGKPFQLNPDPAFYFGSRQHRRAMAYLESHRAKGIVVTGLLYVAENASDLHDAQQTVDTPLNRMSDAELVPGAAALEGVNASLR